MKRKIAALFLVFSLFIPFTLSETSAEFDESQAVDPGYSTNGGPAEIMPPLGR